MVVEKDQLRNFQRNKLCSNNQEIHSKYIQVLYNVDVGSAHRMV